MDNTSSQYKVIKAILEKDFLPEHNTPLLIKQQHITALAGMPLILATQNETKLTANRHAILTPEYTRFIRIGVTPTRKMLVVGVAEPFLHLMGVAGENVAWVSKGKDPLRSDVIYINYALKKVNQDSKVLNNQKVAIPIYQDERLIRFVANCDEICFASLSFEDGKCEILEMYKPMPFDWQKDFANYVERSNSNSKGASKDGKTYSQTRF